MAKKHLTNGRAPSRYKRRTPPGGISLDPARNIADAPPNFDRSVLPHPLTFSAVASSLSKTYRNPDEAVRHSLDNCAVHAERLLYLAMPPRAAIRRGALELAHRARGQEIQTGRMRWPRN